MLTAILLAATLSGEPPQAPRVQILDFGATWCGPCIEADKDLKQQKELTYGDKITCQILKVDYDKNPVWGAAMKVDSLPTFILLVDGKELKRVTGYPGRKFLVDEHRKAEKGLK